MLKIDSITPENLEDLRRILSFNFENIFGKDIKITDDGGYFTSERLEDILQEIGAGSMDWSSLTYAGTFGATVTAANYVTAREDTAGAGYFTVSGFLDSPSYNRNMIYKITVDGVVICADKTMLTGIAGTQVGMVIIPSWFRYNSSYKVEHKLNGTTATGYTTVLEASE